MDLRKIRLVFLLLGVSFCFTAAYGCNRSSAPPPNPVMQSQPGQPAAIPPPSSGGAKAQFMDFQDVPIPQELDLMPKESYVFQIGTTKSGILTLRGRVDINSVINFFSMAMPHQGWKLKGQFRYRKSALIFDKPDKSCVIILYEGTIYTFAEIYVAPATSN